jgi:hypothetical protein
MDQRKVVIFFGNTIVVYLPFKEQLEQLERSHNYHVSNIERDVDLFNRLEKEYKNNKKENLEILVVLDATVSSLSLTNGSLKNIRFYKVANMIRDSFPDVQILLVAIKGSKNQEFGEEEFRNVEILIKKKLINHSCHFPIAFQALLEEIKITFESRFTD